MTQEQEAREAARGERTLTLKVRFWTDKIAEGEGQIVPRHVWGKGMVIVEANRSHGLNRTGEGVAFNSLLELPRAIEKALIAEKITVHPATRERKYLASSTDARPRARRDAR
jgi:hypothetical protein